MRTAVGYMGGSVKNPTYEQVCTGRDRPCGGGAGDLRSCRRSAYQQLLDIFWSVHYPTQLNRQGPDIGPNYRSVIFYQTPEQGKIARASKIDVETSGRFGSGKIVTQIQPAGAFYRAEDYHQQYLQKRAAGAAISDLFSGNTSPQFLFTGPGYSLAWTCPEPSSSSQP